MKPFIVKFVADSGRNVIHKIMMPEFKDKGFYRTIGKWNGFAHGKRKGKISDADKRARREGCCWAPTGLYYCGEWDEAQWLKTAERQRAFFETTNLTQQEIDKADPRLLPVVNHACIDDFFSHIGFDRQTRRYV